MARARTKIVTSIRYTYCYSIHVSIFSSEIEVGRARTKLSLRYIYGSIFSSEIEVRLATTKFFLRCIHYYSINNMIAHQPDIPQLHILECSWHFGQRRS